MKVFVIKQLTQWSTWVGLIIILCAAMLPHSVIFWVGVMIMFTPEVSLAKLFADARAWLEKSWA